MASPHIQQPAAQAPRVPAQALPQNPASSLNKRILVTFLNNIKTQETQLEKLLNTSKESNADMQVQRTLRDFLNEKLRSEANGGKSAPEMSADTAREYGKTLDGLKIKGAKDGTWLKALNAHLKTAQAANGGQPVRLDQLVRQIDSKIADQATLTSTQNLTLQHLIAKMQASTTAANGLMNALFDTQRAIIQRA